MVVQTLPPYPSLKTRHTLSPSQLTALTTKIATTLALTLTLPPTKRSTPSIRTFIRTYAQDHARALLDSLIWAPTQGSLSRLSPTERSIHLRVLQLAEQVGAELGLQTVIDLCVVYARASPKRTRALLAKLDPAVVSADAVEAFTTLLRSSQGLYALRKLSYVLSSFLGCAPEALVRPFAHAPLFNALSEAYDSALPGFARSYGGEEEGARLVLETKVSLLDVTHVLLRTLLADVESASGALLPARTDAALSALAALGASGPSGGHTPFLDRTLLEDHQHAYPVNSFLGRCREDKRVKELEGWLAGLEGEGPGALRVLLRGSGAPVNKGKARASAAEEQQVAKEENDEKLDKAVALVLDVLPDEKPEYVRYVLSHPDYPFRGDGERLLGALLEGTAPSVEEAVYAPAPPSEERIERRNVFDEERIDLARVHVGKKCEEAGAALQDRAFVEQMKADILRRAEAMSDEEEEDAAEGIDVAYEDELDDAAGVKVRDGEPSDDEGSATDADEEAKTPAKPETILELAYIRDPKLFDRDATTRRSKARLDLKAQTGWADEQIEGWRIMLERNPNKDKILQKHEFAGNARGPLAPPAPGPSGQRGRGAPRGGGRARGGRGRGGGGTPEQSGGGGGEGGRGGGSARDRAFKDKNKASRGNHNRKRGHDKKMARAGGPS